MSSAITMAESVKVIGDELNRLLSSPQQPVGLMFPGNVKRIIFSPEGASNSISRSPTAACVIASSTVISVNVAPKGIPDAKAGMLIPLISLSGIALFPEFVPVVVPLVVVEPPEPHSKVISAGHEIIGGVVSTTAIVCTQLAEFPEASVAVHVLEMVPLNPQSCTVASVKVITGFGSVSSAAVAIPAPVGVVSLPHSNVALAGHVITGGVVSCA
jgi:hypothetical protein